MLIKPVIRNFLILQMALLVTSCVSGTGNTATTAAVSRSVPTCIGEADCQAKMVAARNWVVNNTGFAILVDNSTQITTGGWGIDDITAVKVTRAPIGGDRFWIQLEINCGTNSSGPGFDELDCPDSEDSALDFNRVVSSAF
jgi:hypothetical protein